MADPAKQLDEPVPLTGEADGPGEAREPYRVVSFPGSGFDTVMQMGVVHAFLVTRRRAPEMVAGMSVGAITAAALGDVLQSPAGPEGGTDVDEDVRVARFSGLMEAFRNAPTTVLKGFFPDPLETNSANALKPVELPRHFREERDSRRAAVASRTGLIRLFDHLLRVRVGVKLVAQLARAVMGWKAAGEKGFFGRWAQRGRMAARLWWLVARNLFALALPLSLLAKVQVYDLLRINRLRRAHGVEAGHIIFKRGAFLRWLRDQYVWLLLGVVPLTLLLALVPATVFAGLVVFSVIEIPPFIPLSRWVISLDVAAGAALLAGWVYLFFRKSMISNFLKHFQIFRDLGDSYALKEALVQNFDPAYYGEFRFDESVRRALKHQIPALGGGACRKRLSAYAGGGKDGGVMVVPIAANLGTGKLEAIPAETPVVDAVMCACALAPFFKAQTIDVGGSAATFIDGISISNDPIAQVFEEACKAVNEHPEPRWDSLRIISVPLLPVKREKLHAQFEPFTGMVDVALRARALQRFQDMLLDKSLIDRLHRALNGRAATVSDETSEGETFLPAKVRLVAPERPHQLGLRLTQACSAVERRDLIDTAVADGCRAMIERLVTDAMPDARTAEERRLLLEPDEEEPDEWPHRDAGKKATLRGAVEALRLGGETEIHMDGVEYVSCRKLMAAWGGLEALPGSAPVEEGGMEPGPGVSDVCRCCISCPGKKLEDGTDVGGELRQHVRLPRMEAGTFTPPPKPDGSRKGSAVVFLFSGGVFRGVFQVGFANAVSELGIKPDVVAGASVGTIIGALTGRVFQKPEGDDLAERQRQTRRLAATFLTIDRFALTDRFADFFRHLSIRAASADFSPRDLDRLFRRYESDSGFGFGRRVRRVFSGIERLFYLSPFEVIELARTLRSSNWLAAAKQVKKLTQDMADRYGIGIELLGPEPLQQLIDGFVFDGKPSPHTRLDHFGFPLMGTTTNLTLGYLDILRSSNPSDPRFTQSLLAGSAFPVVFRPRWSWEVYRHPKYLAQYADGGIMDNLPLGAVIEYLWGQDGASTYERRPEVPHLILTATLEPEKADWTHRDDLEGLGWAEIRARATQLRYNGKIDKFQQYQRDIRRIIKRRAAEGDPDVHSDDLPLNLDVLAVKPRWLCGTFAFHPMLGFSRKKQAESIAHGCASTICAVAEHFHPGNRAHAVDVALLRKWALGRGIALEQLPERGCEGESGGVSDYGPAKLSEGEQAQGSCWFRRPDAKTGKRPVCPFHPASPAAVEGGEISPELHKIYLACGRADNHVPRGG